MKKLMRMLVLLGIVVLAAPVILTDFSAGTRADDQTNDPMPPPPPPCPPFC